jgi:hypothetical protein
VCYERDESFCQLDTAVTNNRKRLFCFKLALILIELKLYEVSPSQQN